MSSKKPEGKRHKSVSTKMEWKALEVVHPDAAGIDIGGSEHWVAVSPERDPEPVRCFGCFTADLREMARWLVVKGVRSVQECIGCQLLKCSNSTVWKCSW